MPPEITKNSSKLGDYTLWPMELDGRTGADGLLIADEDSEAVVFLMKGTPEFDAIYDLNMADLRLKIIDHFFEVANAEDKLFKVISPKEGSLGGLLKMPPRDEIGALQYEYSKQALKESITPERFVAMGGMVGGAVGLCALIGIIFPPIGFGGALTILGVASLAGAGIYLEFDLGERWLWGTSDMMIDIGYEENNPFLVNYGLNEYAEGWINTAWTIVPIATAGGIAGAARFARAASAVPKPRVSVEEGPVIEVEAYEVVDDVGVADAILAVPERIGRATTASALAILSERRAAAGGSDLVLFNPFSAARVLTTSLGRTISLIPVILEDAPSAPKREVYLIGDDDGVNIGSITVRKGGSGVNIEINANRELGEDIVRSLTRHFNGEDAPYSDNASVPAWMTSMLVGPPRELMAQPDAGYHASSVGGSPGVTPASGPTGNSISEATHQEAMRLLEVCRAEAEIHLTVLKAQLRENGNMAMVRTSINALHGIYSNAAPRLWAILGVNSGDVMIAARNNGGIRAVVRSWAGEVLRFFDLVERAVRRGIKDGAPPADMVRTYRELSDFIIPYLEHVEGNTLVALENTYTVGDLLRQAGDLRMARVRFTNAQMAYHSAAVTAGINHRIPDQAYFATGELRSRVALIDMLLAQREPVANIVRALPGLRTNLQEAAGAVVAADNFHLLQNLDDVERQLVMRVLGPLTMNSTPDSFSGVDMVGFAGGIADSLMAIARKCAEIADRARGAASEAGVSGDTSRELAQTVEQNEMYMMHALDNALMALTSWVKIFEAEGNYLGLVQIYFQAARTDTFRMERQLISRSHQLGGTEVVQGELRWEYVLPEVIEQERLREMAAISDRYYRPAEEALQRAGFLKRLQQAVEISGVATTDAAGNPLPLIEIVSRNYDIVRFRTAIAAALAQESGHVLMTDLLSKGCACLDELGGRIPVDRLPNAQSLPTATDVSQWQLSGDNILVTSYNGHKQDDSASLPLRTILDQLGISKKVFERIASLFRH